MTEPDVRAFIERTTALVSREDKSVPDSAIAAYLDRHLDRKGFFKSEITFEIPDFPPQKSTMTLDKAQFIDNAINGQNALDSYETRVTIEKIQISQKGNRATARTRAQERGMITVPTDEGGQESVPMEGVSVCDQVFKLSDGLITMSNANCKTKIVFQGGF